MKATTCAFVSALMKGPFNSAKETLRSKSISDSRYLVCLAHPDDEILGVGGTICKHVENGNDVYICIVTKAYEPQWSQNYMKTKVKEKKS